MMPRSSGNTIERAVALLRERAQSQIDMTDAATLAGLGELQLLELVAAVCSEREAARLGAKHGADSAVAANAARHIVEYRAIAVAAQGDIERFSAPQIEAKGDAYVYQGRVVDATGIGVAGRIITALGANGQGLVATTTDAGGNFTLTFESGGTPSAADRAAALDPAQAAPAKVARAAIDRGLPFTIQVSGAAGAAAVQGDAQQKVQLGKVDGGEVVVDDAAGTAEHDVLARLIKRFPGTSQAT
jgi:hypothetical protein